MPTYEYKALTNTGKKIIGTQEAQDKAQIIKILREKEYTPLNITEKEGTSQALSLSIFSPVKLKDLAIFTRQFYTMLNAGVSIVKCLDILRLQTEKKKFREVITDIYEDVQKGLMLSDTFKKHPTIFPDLFINMVITGESSGNLDTIMERMSVHFEKENKIKSKVQGAMVYPMVLGSLSIVVVIFLLTFVMPTFVEMFLSSGVELPLPTRILLGISNVIKQYWYLFILGIVLLIFSFSYALKTPKGRLTIDTIKLKIPIVKSSNQKIMTSRFTRTLSTLLSSGIPLLKALDVSSNVVGNEVVKRELMKVKDDMSKGSVLSKQIKESNVFPPMLDSMIQIGEESGALDDILEKTANFYDDEVEAAIQKMLSLIEPLMIVVMSVVIGGIVIAMILPMFNMISTL